MDGGVSDSGSIGDRSDGPLLNPIYPNTHHLTPTPTPTGDVFDEKSWLPALEGATGVVSCIGAFGSNAFMERINGDANVHAAEVAKRAGEGGREGVGGWVLWVGCICVDVCFGFGNTRTDRTCLPTCNPTEPNPTP